MSDFTLPSGRVVPLKDEPTWGDTCDADDAAVAAEREGRSYGGFRATFMMARQTGLSTEDVRALSDRDAQALSKEIGRRIKEGGEAVAADAPLGTPSTPSS